MALRVLHVAQPSDGGALVCAAHLVADQIARGWTVGVATQPNLLSRTAEDHGADSFAWSALRQPGFSTLDETRRLSRIVTGFAPDVLHLHAAKAGLCGRLAVRGRRPTLYQPHGWSFYAADGFLEQAALRWERFAARWSANTICVSDDERLAGVAAGIRSRWTVIPNGVDAGRWRPASPDERAQARRALGVGGDAPLAVTVARLHRAKGVDVLLRAWSELHRRAPSARLIVVGDGPEMATLRRACPSNTYESKRRRRKTVRRRGTMWVPQSWQLQVVGDPAFGAGTQTVTLQSAFPQPGGASIPGGSLTAPVVFVGHGTDADLAGRDVEGQDRRRPRASGAVAVRRRRAGRGGAGWSRRAPPA